MENNESDPLGESVEVPKGNYDPRLCNFNGSWERKNRSLLAAAITGLLGIGALYFNAQSFLLIIVQGFLFRTAGKSIPKDYFERINELTLQSKIPLLVVVTITQYLFMLIGVLWIVKKWHTTDVTKYLRIKLCPLKEIFLAVLITISLLPLCYFLSSLILKAFRFPELYKKVAPQLFSSGSGTEFLFLVFVVAITPAICEEVFFRGYFQRTIERIAGAKSFVITGIIFGLFHMQPLSLIALSILGILFSFFYYRSKSIFPSSAAHFTNNFVALLLLYSGSPLKNIRLFSSDQIPLVYVVISLIVGALLIWVYIKITAENVISD